MNRKVDIEREKSANLEVDGQTFLILCVWAVLVSRAVPVSEKSIKLAGWLAIQEQVKLKFQVIHNWWSLVRSVVEEGVREGESAYSECDENNNIFEI